MRRRWPRVCVSANVSSRSGLPCPVWRIDDDQRAEVTELGPGLAHLGGLSLIAGDSHAGARIGQEVAHLGRGQRWVDRNRDGAPREDGQVSHQPLRAAFADQRHPVTGLDTKPCEAQAQIPDVVEEFAAGVLLEPVARTPPHQDRFRIAARGVERQVGQSRDRGVVRHVGPTSRGTVQSDHPSSRRAESPQ